MDEVIKGLGLANIIFFEELPNCRVCNLDKDKILIICEIELLKDLDSVITRLPGLRRKIMDKINNQNNKEFVQNEKIPMSKFLWDMYVIGLHKVNSEDQVFNPASVSEYERDRFIARKIIIQYEHGDDLKQKFDQLIFPERILNTFPTIANDEDKESINLDSVRTLIKNIDNLIKED
ncbi:ABC-three component system middle component 1 [Alkalihalobacterium elongatum]|uniref:ABC-three component system middle component 1 n=1 Tax=Alkalihalobacterium elongatum TaxID=2675466 RepID=UPI001C1FD615|nr:ABC-three component system middle component 1 [Alkalihalobacterium elongatum]